MEPPCSALRIRSLCTYWGSTPPTAHSAHFGANIIMMFLPSKLRSLFHVAYVFQGVYYLCRELFPLVPVEHLSASEHDGDLYLVALAQKIPQVLQLELEVVLLDLQPQLHLLHLDDSRFFLVSRRPLRRLVLELAVIHDPGDRRNGFRRDLDEIEVLLPRHSDGVVGGRNPDHRAVLIHQPHLFCSYPLVDVRRILYFSGRLL